jgi:NTE family protein
LPDTVAAMPLITNPVEERLEPTMALCLSGGGYRAMLFHVGTLWYLNDARYLEKLARVSSVSGGSIAAGVAATRWKELSAQGFSAASFKDNVVAPTRKLASTTIDVKSVLSGVLWFGSVSDRIVARYREILFGDKTLQDLPDSPRFVINATNVQTGSLFRFSKPYIGDWQIGLCRHPKRLVAEAVAASSAFPPVLSPVRIDFKLGEFADQSGPCNRPPFSTRAILTDGGVYDNMGIETAWKRCRTIFVSDAGAKMQPQSDPHADWARHSLRINSLIDNQVRSLRKRQIVSAFQAKVRDGAYWGMWTDPGEYEVESRLSLPAERAHELAQTPTRLAALSDELQERLINFGYGMAERAIRAYYDKAAFEAAVFPYARGI